MLSYFGRLKFTVVARLVGFGCGLAPIETMTKDNAKSDEVITDLSALYNLITKNHKAGKLSMVPMLDSVTFPCAPKNQAKFLVSLQNFGINLAEIILMDRELIIPGDELLKKLELKESPMIYCEDLFGEGKWTFNAFIACLERLGIFAGLPKRNTDGNYKTTKTEKEILNILNAPQKTPFEENKNRTETFACDICEKTFNTKKLMTVHKHIHDGKIHPCEHCGKSYSTRSYLRKHLNEQHEKKRRLKCKHCESTFSRKQSRTRHVHEFHPETLVTEQQAVAASASADQSSSGESEMKGDKEKKYSCEICGKMFKSPASIPRHVSEQHGKKKQLKCNHCTVTFTRNSARNQHVKDYHPEKLVDGKVVHVKKTDQAMQQAAAASADQSSTSDEDNSSSDLEDIGSLSDGDNGS